MIDKRLSGESTDTWKKRRCLSDTAMGNSMGEYIAEKSLSLKMFICSWNSPEPSSGRSSITLGCKMSILTVDEEPLLE